ncbi:hypothetical protein HYX03_02855 [Candidatus Woesearchaeota archaeon]|nr:hypothetical protein [Candidatus Woesearchaeota archaeon]
MGIDGISTRREFLVGSIAALSMAAAEPVKFAYSQTQHGNVIQQCANDLGEGHYYEGKVKIFGIIHALDVAAVFDRNLYDNHYCSKLTIFRLGEKDNVLYSYNSQGLVYSQKLLPTWCRIYRNFSIGVWPLILAKHDSIVFDFEYDQYGNRLSIRRFEEVREGKKSTDKNGVLIPYRGPGTILDLLTGIVQTLNDMKNGRKPEAATLLSDVGNPSVASIDINGRVIKVNVDSEDFSFKSASMHVDDSFEPLEVKIERAYSIVDLEGQRVRQKSKV